MMFGHLPDVLPVLVQRKAHHIENAIQLIVMIRIAGLDVLLAAMENRFGGEQLGENASNRPDIDGLRVVPGAQQQFRRPIPEGDDNRIQIGQRLERSVEQPSESHVGDLDATAFRHFAHHQNVGWFLKFTFY